MNQQKTPLIKKYSELNSEGLLKILGNTIKHDDINKLVAFICQLTAYTEDSQINLSFNAPSSSGKSYIPLEIASLFPKEDVIKLGYVSPTSFFHNTSDFNKETKEYIVDLSRKILIFMDQPHTLLLEHLRPLLSHDEKEISVQITDKNQKSGLRAKKIILRGFPAVTFCSAGLRIDEQEMTRFLLLSPEISQEKIRAGILEALKKAADKDAYWDQVNLDPARQQLIGRIQAIRDADIKDVRISSEDQEYIIKRFFSSVTKLKPRHQRDIKRLVALIKGFALLNVWHRQYEGSSILAKRTDIDEAFAIWAKISVAQELSLPPYVYQLYQEVILVAFNEKNDGRNEDIADMTGLLGLTRQEVQNKHMEVYGRPLDAISFRQQIIPMLLQASLIYEQENPSDRRNKLIYPELPEKYSESAGGVSAENEQILEDVKRIFGGGELIQ